MLAGAFLGAALFVYAPAFDGPFVSDDVHYVESNRYVHELSGENVAVILDPTGPATLAIVNYAPAQLLVHAVAWRLFGSDTTGHHVVNVVLHALASVLLVALFLRVGVPRPAALAGGALFLLHPANVEAVAWISQLKSTLALVLSLAALLAWPRRPLLGSVGFVLALLAKATAAFALPVAALLDWTRSGEGARKVRWGWLAVWALAFVGYAVAEFATHQRSGAAEAGLLDTPLVLLRTMVALTGRYLVMATTSVGVSAFHEPDPATSWLDPWWLFSLVALSLLGWRVWVVARRARVELAFWAWAVISFVPVSQLFPFLYPMADRYLYFILPGLLGGALLAGAELFERLAPDPDRRRLAGRAALAGALMLCALFTVRSLERAALWRSNALLLADAADHYPEGKAGLLRRAKRAALLGDAPGAVEALGRARARGYNRFEQLAVDPGWNLVRSDPAFERLLHEMAGDWIERARAKRVLTQTELRGLAHAHIARRELDRAVAELRRAVEQGGPYTAEIRAELTGIESALRTGHPDRIRLGNPGR
ncbi:MAG: hypothetical protein QNK04_12790 [Myxococcota bacterium]|nr:hypothetical protein [Myxococcota bacterium]